MTTENVAQISIDITCDTAGLLEEASTWDQPVQASRQGYSELSID
jgi:hypothetical protein